MQKSGKANPRKLPPAELRLRVLIALVGALLATIAGHRALDAPGMSLRYWSYDIPFMVHRAGTPEDIRIVYLDRIAGNVLDRSVQANLLDRLNEAGARAVIYDVVFDLPSADPAVDIAFADAMRRFRGVDAQGEPVPGQTRRHVFLACGSDYFHQTGVEGMKLSAPTDDLLDAADDFGLVAFVHDEQFTVRELIAGTKDEPSLAWKAALALGATWDEGTRQDPRWLNYAGPPPDGQALDMATSEERDRKKPAILSCGAADVLHGSAPGLFRNKIVVIGGRPGIAGMIAGADLFATPFHCLNRRGNLPLMSGVELQANALNNYLHGNWLTRSTYRSDLWLIVIAGIIAGIGFTFFRPAKGLLVAVLLIAGLIIAGTCTVHFNRLWFPWSVVAFLQVPLAYVWGSGSRFYIERHFRVKLSEEQKQLHDAFSKYLSPQMLQQLIDDGFKMEPGGTKMHAAMMFTDLESFTDMCEQVGDSGRIVETLNDYFERTTRHIFEHEGVVIKYIGDAIFAAWGVPRSVDSPALKAVRAAWELFQSNRLVVDGCELQTRIGIHYGEVHAGHVGSMNRVDYTLIGDNVNLTARLEGMNKMLGTHVLVSDEVARELGMEFRLRKVGSFRVKGRKTTTVVHELLGLARQEQEPAWITEYHRGIAALEAGDAATATACFETAKSLRGADGPSDFFLTALKEGTLLPGGVCELKEK